jgi:hypothetical protein
MRLFELLLEKLTATVHVNSDKSLFLIADRIEKSFGPQFTKISGGCLTAQVIYAMSAAAKIKPDDLIYAINQSKLSAGVEGLTLEKLANFFQSPFKLKDGSTVEFKLSFENPSLDQAISDVKSGQSVVLIPSADLQYVVDDVADSTDGIVKFDSDATQSNVLNNRFFHAYLIVGYDAKEDFLIIRDMRSTYLFKGYAKIRVKDLRRAKKAYKLVNVVVDDFIKKPKTK